MADHNQIGVDIMSAKDISLVIKTDDDTCFYIRLDDMEETERQTLLESLKQGDFTKSIKLLAAHKQSHFMTRNKKKPSILHPPTLRDRPTHLEQTSLGQNADFGAEPDVASTYEKARNGDKKALRLIGEWANQGDKRAKTFLIQISKTPEQTRKRVIIL